MSLPAFDFKVIDPKDIPECKRGRRSGSRYAATISQFMRSGAAAIEITELTTKPHTVAHSYRQTVKRVGLEDQVKALTSGGRVFLVRLKP